MGSPLDATLSSSCCGVSRGSLLAHSHKGSSRYLFRCLLIGLAFFLIQTSRASVEWVVDAQVAMGGKVSGFFTINSSNQVLD
jgi:hypothetical protein